MADADSLHDQISDLDEDDNIDADGEEDEAPSPNALDGGGARKKMIKRRKPTKNAGRSSGDSDSHCVDGEEMGCGDMVAAGSSDTANEGDDEHGTTEDDRTPGAMDKLSQIQRAMEMFHLQQEMQSMQGAPQGAPKSMEDAQRKKYVFWDTQPVPKLDEKVTGNGAIEEDKTRDEVRQEEYTLPAGFHWDTMDITNPMQLKELYTLLNENYVEDDDNMFRFDYSPEFLQWALQPPGWEKDWHCGVRVTKSKKLIGFISAVPAHIKVYEKKQKMVEINFLCVHKKLRSKRVAPVLIREITRRVNLNGIFQAVYTAGVVLPKPVAKCRYWHRSLNPRKLIDVKFSHLSRNMTMQRTLKLYKLPDRAKTPGFRALTSADVTKAFNLLASYLARFELSPIFTEDEFRHWFLPRKGIVDAYVVEVKGEITDFVSFYTLPSTVMHHPEHKSLKAAYSFYNVAGSTPWTQLMNDALIVAKNSNFDVFNALDLMDNKECLEKLKFGIGDGNLQYYLYNWRCPAMNTQQVGLVLQ